MMEMKQGCGIERGWEADFDRKVRRAHSEEVTLSGELGRAKERTMRGSGGGVSEQPGCGAPAWEGCLRGCGIY